MTSSGHVQLRYKWVDYLMVNKNYIISGQHNNMQWQRIDTILTNVNY